MAKEILFGQDGRTLMLNDGLSRGRVKKTQLQEKSVFIKKNVYIGSYTVSLLDTGLIIIYFL